MAVSASHFTEVTNGFEQKTNGLWVHRGKFSVGPVGTAPASPGDINANRGAGAGVYYFGGDSTKYLYYDGTNFHLNGGLLKAQAGSAQQLVGHYLATPSWSTPSAGVWHETPIQCSGVFGQTLLRIEANLNIYNNTVGAYTQAALGYNGSPAWALCAAHQEVVNNQIPLSLFMYYNAPAGTTRISVFLSASTGQSSIWNGVYAQLAVTEQRM